MLYKFLLFAFLSFTFTYALPRPQPVKHFKDLQQANLIPPQFMLSIFGTDLEGIVTARAFTSSLFSNLRNEFTGDRLFLQLYSPHSDTLIYLSISLIVVYGQWKFHQGSQSREKFQKIDSFNKKESFLKNLIFIILFVFTKDVLSAT
jgi:hypothetical protein